MLALAGSFSFFLWQAVKKNHLESSPSLIYSLGESVSRASLLALLSASLFVVDPALAFKVNLTMSPCLVLERLKQKRNKNVTLRKKKNVILFWVVIDWIIGLANCGKGGGPYGSEVTRGQDLTGKDFSGRTLIRQDFKTVRLASIMFLASYTSTCTIYHVCIVLLSFCLVVTVYIATNKF